MYAIIRTGGKQAKVREGDVVDIERVKDAGENISFVPLLLVGEDSSVTADRAVLEEWSVMATVLGENRGEKINIFKYKNKTGYRRRYGHRQNYTRIEVTKIAGPSEPSATENTVQDEEVKNVQD